MGRCLIDREITPDLQAKIDKIRAEREAGKNIILKSKDDIDAYFAEL